MKATEFIKKLQREVDTYGDLDVIVVVDSVTQDKVKGGQVCVSTYGIDVEMGDDGELMITCDAESD